MRGRARERERESERREEGVSGGVLLAGDGASRSSRLCEGGGFFWFLFGFRRRLSETERERESAVGRFRRVFWGAGVFSGAGRSSASLLLG